MALSEEEQEKILDGIREQLNSFYNGDPKYIMPGYNEEKCRGFVRSLFKCMYRGRGIAVPMDSKEKETIADLVREYPVEDLFAIFDMGKMAMAGNREARFDLVKWYSAASYRGLMERGERRQAHRILQKYRTEY
jgi:hypothetical protein